MLEAGLPGEALISIVDDDSSVREATKSLVKSFGFAVETYSSAEEFLASGRCESTTCLIADVQMPGMSGLDLHRKLVSFARRIPTLLITAYPDERIRAEALQAGVICYLAKPFKEIELLLHIRSALGRQGVDCEEP